MAQRVDFSKYRVESGSFSLKSINPADTQDFTKSVAKKILRENQIANEAWQEKLYAEGKRSVLLVLQAMDAGGKDSTIEAITEDINPQGCRVTSFKAPSKLELAHDFLWRIHQAAPQKGYIGIFNRSHYEDVLIVKVKGWACEETIEKRYEHINAFEKLLVDNGTVVIKIMLHISPEYQLSRFQERLSNPEKWWKFNPDDLKERASWDAYMEAFEVALNRCSTAYAPWYVIPAEHKWFRTMVVSSILRDTFEKMNPTYPPPEYDPKSFNPNDLV